MHRNSIIGLFDPKRSLFAPETLLLLVFMLQSSWSIGIAWGVLPRVGIAYLLAIMVLIILAKKTWHVIITKKIPRKGLVEILLWGTLLWISIIQAVAYTDAGVYAREEYIRTLGSTLVGSWAAALSGWYFAGGTRRLAGLIWFILIITIGIGCTFSWIYFRQFFVLFYNPFLPSASPEAFKLNYLLLGDTLAVTSIIFLGQLLQHKRIFVGAMVYYVSIFALFLSFSRTSFLLGVLSLTVLWGLSLWKKIKLKAFLGLGLVGLLAGMLGACYYTDIWTSLDIASRRLTSLMQGMDDSLDRRIELLAQIPNYLPKYWLSGRFLYEFLEGEGVGAYVHNWLSFWLAFGIGPFLLSLVTIFLLCVHALRQRSVTEISLLAYLIFSIALSRSYVWIHYWFILAYVSMGIRRLTLLHSHKTRHLVRS